MADLSIDSPCGSPCSDALERLADGHEQTRALAEECRRVARRMCRDGDIRQVAETLCKAIHRMAALEEEVFYPAARAALQASCDVDMAKLEYATARQIIRQMQLADPSEARYEALVMALADCVDRHTRYERSQLFPKVRQSCMDLDALGQRIRVHEQVAASI